MIKRLNCTAGDRALVVRNTCNDPCMAASVGRYVVVVRAVAVDDDGQPRWTFEGPPKPCARLPFCAIHSYRDADLQPLPPEGDVQEHDRAVEAKQEDPVVKVLTTLALVFWARLGL